MSQYKTINQLDITQPELEQWAAKRETSEIVALAIHATAGAGRTPEVIWEEPTPAEVDHVKMAVENYVGCGECEAEDEYRWGEEAFSL